MNIFYIVVYPFLKISSGQARSFNLPQAGQTNLNVFDIEGREVRQLINGFTQSGANVITFNGEGLPTGAYFLRLSGPNREVGLQKIILGK